MVLLRAPRDRDARPEESRQARGCQCQRGVDVSGGRRRGAHSRSEGIWALCSASDGCQRRRDPRIVPATSQDQDGLGPRLMGSWPTLQSPFPLLLVLSPHETPQPLIIFKTNLQFDAVLMF